MRCNIFVWVYLLICGTLAVVVPGLSETELSYLKDDPEVTHRLTIEVSHKVGEDDRPIGKLTFGLFGKTVPKTVDNFIKLNTGELGFGYERCIFHRIIKDFVVQGGDFKNADGTGGYSIYNKGSFDDENFDVKHNKKGRLSMANSGPNTNGAQFFIVTGNLAPHLDGHHVVFGQLILGFDTLDTLNKVETKDSRPVDEWLFKYAGLQALNTESEPDTFKIQSTEPAEKETTEEFQGSYGRYLAFCVLFSIGGLFLLKLARKRRGLNITGFRS